MTLSLRDEAAAVPVPAIEWPTLLLCLVVYGGWLSVTAAYRSLPLWVVAPLATLLVALHSSLQHEILHGHPTRWQPVNHLLGVIPLALWLPYERYRRSHLKHHLDDRLTDPIDDPESNYWTREAWGRLGPLGRWLVRVQSTLLGRWIVGPFWRIPRFLWVESRRFVAGGDQVRLVWIEHLLWCAVVIGWLYFVCHMPVWIYALCVAAPAYSILLTRSFAEHRAEADVRHRIAIVERSWFLGPLFLFNNLHSLHHEAPRIPWYRYNRYYRGHRDRLIRENGGLVYLTYFDLMRRYLLTPHDVLVHPTDRVPPTVDAARA